MESVTAQQFGTYTEDDLESFRRSDERLRFEILSPSTRRADLSIKKERLSRAGCPCYWVIDPERPTLLAWQLRGRTYELVAEATGSQEVQLTAPFPVTLTPAALVSRP